MGVEKCSLSVISMYAFGQKFAEGGGGRAGARERHCYLIYGVCVSTVGDVPLRLSCMVLFWFVDRLLDAWFTIGEYAVDCRDRN
jgi:hypothetical protein